MRPILEEKNYDIVNDQQKAKVSESKNIKTFPRKTESVDKTKRESELK